MKRDHNAAAWLIFYIMGGAVWLVLVLLKASGLVYIMGWLPLGLGVLWIPTALTALVYVIVWSIEMAERGLSQYKERKRRRKVARTLWEAMHGLTLNSVGPIYGVKRKAGEQNKGYERRILKAARTVDKVNLTAPLEEPIRPATGLKLDVIAKKHGLTRRPGETDEALQERIRDAVILKLERRTKNGL